MLYLFALKGIRYVSKDLLISGKGRKDLMKLFFKSFVDDQKSFSVDAKTFKPVISYVK